MIVIGSLVTVVGLTLAQEKQPDATIRLSTGSVALGIGFTWGSGVLTYQGKEYPIRIDGLSVADVGISEASANEPVSNLKKLEDFNDTCTGVTADATIGGGAGAAAIQNQNGVND